VLQERSLSNQCGFFSSSSFQLFFYGTATGGNLEDPTIISHLMRVQDYLWVAEDGMKMQGYNGSQCWDTSFCAQAMYDANLMDDFPQVTRKIWAYLERTQILSTEVSKASPAYQFESNHYRNKFYRHISEGGWPFSTSAHGWPISDCTGEGLKATLCLLKSKAVQAGLQDESLKKISNERLYKAVNVLLAYQNEDGGWATYENNRGWGWYEQLNPSEVFGDIMIDYSYVECSMAALTAMVDFREVFPEHRVNDLQHSIDKGCAFLKSIQRSDGSWYGSWACCFSYGIWFGVEGLVKCGEPVDSPCILRACEFLLKHQRPNGGWGEDFTSCYDKDYAKEGMKAYGDNGSGIVNTSWALLALSMAKCKDVDAIRRGVQYLIQRQLPCGDWPQEGISGVFNRSVGITYTAYRNVFPIWAMGRCCEEYGNELDK
jgi:cycloartenol synthase